MFQGQLFKSIKKDFKNKYFILTGYSSGIGNQIYKDLKKLGAKPILVGRKKIKKEIYYPCDLRKLKELEKVIKNLINKFKKIDGFVHCAGINQCLQSEKISLEDWQEVINVNLSSAFIISKEIKNNLKKSKNPSIIFFSSIAGHRKSIVSGVHYVSSKAGLIGLAKQLSHEMGKFGIRVNCISPSQTATKMLKKSMNKKQIKKLISNIPLKKLSDVKDQSNGAIFLLSSLSKYITGTSLNIDGGQI